MASPVKRGTFTTGLPSLIEPIYLGTAGSRPGKHSGTAVNKEMPAQESQWLLWAAVVPAGEDEGRSINLNSNRIQNP